MAAAIKEALRTLQLIHLAGVEVIGEVGVLDFSSEIVKLTAALSLMAVEEDVTEDAGGCEPL